MFNISELQYITQDIQGHSHAELAEFACKGGVDWIQVRIKDKPVQEWKQIASEVLEVCKKYNARLIVNDNIEIAKAIGAHGVHVGLTDTPVEKAREYLGNKFIIGGTANTFEDIKKHYNAGANYVGVGPFRFTNTKKNLSPILGIKGYEAITNQCKQEKVSIPVIAIGGILCEDIE
ncbi:MAG TPA: thiamine phosphate synthase, partial [Cytophagaceae bacterium]